LKVPGSLGLVLHIAVQRTAQIARAHDKKAYVRRGAQCLEVKGEALERLRLTKGIESYEKQTVDVDVSTITESPILQQFVKQVVPNLEPKVFLRKQNLVKSGKPTVAAALLFSEEPQAALPKRSGVKLYRYKTSGEPTRETMAGTPTSIEGPVVDLVRKSVQQTVAMVEGIQKLGPSGLEPVKYPHETLHEIVTNAILHRDYSIASDVHIRVFDNRVEVESPGLLPGQVTVRNILDEQFARNPMLVRLTNKFPDPPNKDVGEGLNTAFKAMQKLRLKPPVIEEKDTAVLIQIRHDPLASPEESVMDYLHNHAEITNRVARELTGITSENSMKDVFLRLQKRNLIERVPDKKGAAAAWQKVKASNAA
jgi:ATP-dependent DNA helicase RecG